MWSKYIRPYLKNVFIAIDQAVNAIFFFGCPDETFSSRCYRWDRDGIRHYPKAIIDFIAKYVFKDEDHCHASYISEALNRQNAPEFRK